jgi:hypothetical protein
MADKAELFRRSLPFSHLISAPGKGLILLKLMRGAEILNCARSMLLTLGRLHSALHSLHFIGLWLRTDTGNDSSFQDLHSVAASWVSPSHCRYGFGRRGVASNVQSGVVTWIIGLVFADPHPNIPSGNCRHRFTFAGRWLGALRSWPVSSVSRRR